MRGTRAWPPTGLIPWFSKTEGNTYATLLHHPFLFKGKPTQCSRGSKKDFWRRCRGDSRQVKSRFDSQQQAIFGAVAEFAQVNIPSTHHKPLSPALHYLPFASRFPLPHFTLAVLFALSFPFAFFFSPLTLSVVMSEIGEIIADMDNNNIIENSDAPAKEPTNFHTKKFCVGSGNIIGKRVIQDFFTCAGALPSMGSYILHRTIVLRTLFPCL